MLVFFAHTFLFENAASHNLGTLCMDRFGVYNYQGLSALRTVCCVSCVHVPRVFCYRFKKNKNRPPIRI